MRKSYLAIVSLACLIALSFTASPSGTSQSINRDGLKGFQLSAGTDKRIYALFEPMEIGFQITNTSGAPKKIYRPDVLSDGSIEVVAGRQDPVVMSLGAGSPGLRIPGVVQEGWSMADSVLLSPAAVGRLFPSAGSYRVKFILRDLDGGTLETDTISLSVVEPTGNTKQALEFMRANHQFFGLSAWIPRNEDDLALLNTLANRYEKTAYGDSAIAHLGTYYLSRGEFSKARSQFEKITGSSKASIATGATKALREIESKMKN